MGNTNTQQSDGGGGSHSEPPVGWDSDAWAAAVAEARELYWYYHGIFMTQFQIIVDLNAQVIAISYAKSSLYNCKNDLISTDSLLAEIKDNSIKVDYGNNYHSKIEALTNPPSGSVNGFEDSIEMLNDAKDDIKKDLKNAATIFEDAYNWMNYYNGNYDLGYILPNKDDTMDMLEKAMEGE